MGVVMAPQHEILTKKMLCPLLWLAGGRTVRARGPTFTITPKYPPKEVYVAAVEEACSRLPPREADELRSDSSCLLRKHCPQQTKHQSRGMKGH